MMKGMIITMNEIQNVFKELIDALDMFFEKEEKKIGCLTAEEHSNFIKIRNYIDDVFMRVINAEYGEDKQLQKQNTDTTATVSIIVDNDDDEGGADICFMKRSHQMEI